MKSQPFLRAFVSPAALCAMGFLAAMAAVLQYSLRAYIPGSLQAGGPTFDNFTALLQPLYARVFLDTVWICFVTAACTLMLGYPVAYALVRTRHGAAKAAILVIVVTPLFLGEVVRTYSWIIVLGNSGFLNAMLLRLGLIATPLQFMFTTLGVVIALVHVTMPVMVIMLAAGLSHIDPNLERAARESLRGRSAQHLPHRHLAAVRAWHCRWRHDGLCLDLQRIRDPAADWWRAGKHDF